MTRYTAQLEVILESIEALESVDVDGVEPFLSAAPSDDVFREDEAGEHMERDTALRNAPRPAEGFFQVPSVR